MSQLQRAQSDIPFIFLASVNEGGYKVLTSSPDLLRVP